VFAIINRSAIAIFASSIGRDKQLQLTMAENLMAGNGLSLVKYFTNDLYTPVYDSSQVFPPGYSLIIIPFLKVFRDNFLACTVLDVFSAIAFVLLVRVLCKKIKFAVSIVNLITIITGCSQAIFFLEAAPTDVISLNFILASFIVAINTINNSNHTSLLKIAGYGLLFIMPSFFRYMYIPFSPLLPLLIYFWGHHTKRTSLKKIGLQLIVVVFIFQAVMIIWLKSQSPVFIVQTEKGIFPEELLHWYPFFVASFINIDFIAQRIEQVADISYTNAVNILKLFNLVLIPIFIAVIRNILSKRKLNFFFLDEGVLSITILLTLIFLTLTNKAQKVGFSPWNYTQEGRYFAFLNIFLVFFFFYYLTVSAWQKRLPTRMLAIFIFILLGIETTHGIYFNMKLPFQYKKMREIVIDERATNYFDLFLRDAKTTYPDADLFVSSPNSYYNNYASSKEIKAIYDPVNLNNQVLNVSRKSILLLVLESSDVWMLNQYLKRKKPKLIKVIPGAAYFYIEELSPANP
jgi:hypothetical protein